MVEREKDLRENFSIGAFIGYLFAESAEKYHMIVVTGMEQADFGTSKIHVVKPWIRLWRCRGSSMAAKTCVPH